MESDERFSAGLLTLPADEYPALIQDVIAELRAEARVVVEDVRIWSEQYFGVILVVEVDRPTRGTVGNVDVRDYEPVILLLHKDRYPFEAPRARLDRRSFPRNLPHLNPVGTGQALSMCLHRGDFNTWFHEHSLGDVVLRIRGWLRDAATNRLQREDDRFEPTLVSDIGWISIFSHEDLRSVVSRAWEASGGAPGWTYLIFKLLSDTSDHPLARHDAYAVEVQNPVDASLIPICAKISDISIKMHKADAAAEQYIVGLAVWPSQNTTSCTHVSQVPKDVAELRDFALAFGWPLGEALAGYDDSDAQRLAGVPLIGVIQRPRPLIGADSRLEPLCFLLLARQSQWEDGALKDDTQVHFLSHREPLSPQQSRSMSLIPDRSGTQKVTFIGCGALGSKVALHFARSGQTWLTLCDADSVEPHNLVRHALLGDARGKNKAKALASAIRSIYGSSQVSESLNVVERSFLDWIAEAPAALRGQDLVVDASASLPVLHALVAKDIGARCARVEMTDRGRLGLVSIEGEARNPRLDDVRYALFDAAIENARIAAWLKDHRSQYEGQTGPALEEISVGVGCRSPTLRVADDVVSLHAAAASRVLHGVENSTGGVLVSVADGLGNDLSLSTIRVECGPVIAHRADGWEIRVRARALGQMRDLLSRAAPNETGGLLIGAVWPKQRVVYVTRALPAPADSMSSPHAFVRGIEDVPREIVEIRGETGELLDYIGEWHTHPDGDVRASLQDRQTIARIRKVLDRVGVPTLVIIVGHRAYSVNFFAVSKRRRRS